MRTSSCLSSGNDDSDTSTSTMASSGAGVDLGAIMSAVSSWQRFGLFVGCVGMGNMYPGTVWRWGLLSIKSPLTALDM